MINDFLDLCQDRIRTHGWCDREIRIGEVLGRAANAVRGMFANTPEVKLVVDLPDDLPPLHVDPDRIEQCFSFCSITPPSFTARGSVALTARDKRLRATGKSASRTRARGCRRMNWT
jgi:hypothetical protein